MIDQDPFLNFVFPTYSPVQEIDMFPVLKCACHLCRFFFGGGAVYRLISKYFLKYSHNFSNVFYRKKKKKTKTATKVDKYFFAF